MRAERYHALRYPSFALFMAAAVFGWWRFRPFRVVVEGHSMAPELRSGDCLIALRPRRIRAFDVVVLEHPERPGFELVKRVAGVPGQRVEGRTLGPAEYWVLGSHEGGSDSRAFGLVDRSAIRGVVVLRYWPWRRRALLLPGQLRAD